MNEKNPKGYLPDQISEGTIIYTISKPSTPFGPVENGQLLTPIVN